MTGQPSNEIVVAWEDYHLAIERLAVLVHRSGWTFDQVLCLARGGLRAGDIFSRIFKLPLAILSTSSYRAQSGTVRETLHIGQHISTGVEELRGRVLLVDDLVDSGETVRQVIPRLRAEYPAISEIRTAVIWYKTCSVIRPDYFLESVEENVWIRQPFEQYDHLDIEVLEKKCSGADFASS